MRVVVCTIVRHPADAHIYHRPATRPGPCQGRALHPSTPNCVAFKVDPLGSPFQYAELVREINGQMPGYVDGAAELQV